MLCFKRKRNEDQTVSIRSIEDKKKFTSIEETYTIYMFLMSIGMMYPNPKTEKNRLVALFFMFVLFVPTIVILVDDILVRIQDGDMENLTRQIIVLVASMYSYVKICLTFIYKKNLQEVFHIINSDYAKYNDLPEDYHVIVQLSIKWSKLIERAWTMIMFCASGVFPASAIILNIYFLFFTDSPRRFMLHECRVLGTPPEIIYSTPIYEYFFLYSMYIVVLIFVAFSAYDGMFSICIGHASLKLKILMNKLRHVLDDKSDLVKIKSNVAEVLRDQLELYDFIGKVMKCYSVWLVMMFTLSVTQTGMALAQITSDKGSGGTNFVYVIFMCTSTAHIFFPCYFCSDVTHMGALLADIIYSIPWEDVKDPSFRRSICFMIARAQIPLDIIALKLLTFNMEMFVSVLRTAYSVFALLRQ